MVSIAPLELIHTLLNYKSFRPENSVAPHDGDSHLTLLGMVQEPVQAILSLIKVYLANTTLQKSQTLM